MSDYLMLMQNKKANILDLTRFFTSNGRYPTIEIVEELIRETPDLKDMIPLHGHVISTMKDSGRNNGLFMYDGINNCLLDIDSDSTYITTIPKIFHLDQGNFWEGYWNDIIHSITWSPSLLQLLQIVSTMKIESGHKADDIVPTDNVVVCYFENKGYVRKILIYSSHIIDDNFVNILKQYFLSETPRFRYDEDFDLSTLYYNPTLRDFNYISDSLSRMFDQVNKNKLIKAQEEKEEKELREYERTHHEDGSLKFRNDGVSGPSTKLPGNWK